MFIFRFFIPLLVTLTLLAALATPITERLVLSWFKRDVEQRSYLLMRSVDDVLATMWHGEQDLSAYKKLFDNIARDNRVLAVGLCRDNAAMLIAGQDWPSTMHCPPAHQGPEFSTQMLERGEIMMSSFPLLLPNGPRLSLVIVHDLNFIVQRVRETKLFFLGFTIVVALMAALVTIITARLTLRSWLGRLRQTLTDPQTPLARQDLPRDLVPVAREVRQMLRDMRRSAYQLDNTKVEWTPQTLKRLLEEELPETEAIIVSNREPYIHNLKDGAIALQRPASGVVTALEPIMRACGGTWVAHGSGSGDRQTVDANDCIAVPPEAPDYTLRRVWLSTEEEEGYYYGFANEGLWPLCHISFVRPNFRASDWEHYKAVNRKFADAVVAQAKTSHPVVLVQDYHFALLPRYIREKLPDATILTFWHIPWPNPEMFSICPWREEILAGLLGSSVIGFHTQFHCQNFMDSVDRFLESNINRDQSIVMSQGQATLIRPYPISIAWPPVGLETVAAAPESRAAVLQRFGLKADAVIGVGVERFDYTKGITDRFQAVREFLRLHPEWRGRFSFIQAVAPTRSQLPAYQTLQEETIQAAAAINAEFGTADYQPIILNIGHHEPAQVFELFRAADLCFVSSLHDGMNLVAKEFVASRDDEQGVLILSSFAGASKELLEALLVNPYDTIGMANAIQRALTMPAQEERERMRLLRGMVRDNNVFFWAARMLLDASQLRKRARIEKYVSGQVISEDGDDRLTAA